MNSRQKLEKARRYARNMRRQMTRRRHKALLNTDRAKTNELNKAYMDKVIEFFGGLKAMGFRTADEDEPHPGRVVPITKKWIKEQRAKETELDKLQRRIRNTKDEELRHELSRELIYRMAKGEV